MTTTLPGPPATLHGRSFLKELDHTPEEWRALLDLTRHVKLEHASGFRPRRLREANVAVIFEKASTRTRCAFEVAAHQEGAHVTYLDPTGSHLGHKESVKDTARVLGRMYDGIEYRGFAQDTVEEMAAHAGVPVWNGLTDRWHPTQSLCDTFTMSEHTRKPLHEVAVAFVGDADDNVANSLLVAGAMLGMDVRMVSPEGLRNPAEVREAAAGIAARTGARITVTDDPEAGVRGADFVYTDVWVSMGEPEDVWRSRVELLAPYRVDAALMAATGNPDVKFLHCLPAFHNRETEVGEEVFRLTGMDGLEVTEEVFESPASVVFDQAENRMHSIKAVMVATLGDQLQLRRPGR